jgi:uncharacterized protein (TIGR03067 family)
MNRFAPAILSLCLGLAFGRADDKAVHDEWKKLEGVWSALNAEVDGKPVPDAQKPPRLEFKGNKLLGLGPEYTFTVDPSKSPKQIELVARVGGIDIKSPAIYEINDDELKLCIPLLEKAGSLDFKRPDGFDCKAVSAILIRLKRVK